MPAASDHGGTCVTLLPSIAGVATEPRNSLDVRASWALKLRVEVARTSASNSAPKARISSELARWRVICAGVLLIVMLAIAPSRVLKKPVTRAETGPDRPSRPASKPVSRSGSSAGLGLVWTLPARKPRCSSFSVGVR